MPKAPGGGGRGGVQRPFLPTHENMDLLSAALTKHDLFWLLFGTLAPVSNLKSCLTWLFTREYAAFIAFFVS